MKAFPPMESPVYKNHLFNPSYTFFFNLFGLGTAKRWHYHHLMLPIILWNATLEPKIPCKWLLKTLTSVTSRSRGNGDNPN